jgi:hypothetical protein
MSPDPYGGSYDFSDPQSFNRYSCVQNDPMSANDPLGLEMENPMFMRVLKGHLRLSS